MAERQGCETSAECSHPSRSRQLWASFGWTRQFLVFASIAGVVASLAAFVVVGRAATPSSIEPFDVPAFVGAGPASSEPSIASDRPLLGEAVSVAAGSIHALDPTDLIPGDLPSAGGPHAAEPLPTGVFDDPIAVEGSAVHSLEHGAVWIAYSPTLLSDAALTRLDRVARSFSEDVILAPRPQNAAAITLVSWGQRLVTQDLDEARVADFVRTNRNRSPEPGIR